jgi:hypothetical protein
MNQAQHKELRNAIASAIKKADSSYFFEDYSKQAGAVLKVLEKEGYALLPLEPNSDMIKSGLDSITSGSIKPEKLVTKIYAAMIAKA